MTLSLLAACTPEPEPNPTKTALFASEEEAFAAAEETYQEYLDAYASIDASDPKSYEETQPFIAGDYAAAEREGLSELRAEGLTRKGTSVLVAFEGTRFVKPDRIEAHACTDVSGTDIVDAGGNSVVSPDRPDKYALELTFVVDGDKLKLTDAQAVEDPTCV